jgi:hypothetical protein
MPNALSPLEPLGDLRALTLTEPWATLMAFREKWWETRSWGTSYRGWVAIHAAKGMPRDALAACTLNPFWVALHRHGCVDVEVAPAYQLITTFDETRGRIVAIGRVVSCVRITPEFAHRMATQQPVPPAHAEHEFAFGDYTPGRFAWRFAEVVRVEPIATRGALGLWTVPEDVRSQLRAAA